MHLQEVRGNIMASETEPDKKQFHIFISYRVHTDAELAEKLCDKLQALTILNEQREVRIRCFLDKQNLKEGRDYTSQFMDALTGSCLVLPLVSEGCLESMQHIQEGGNDSVVREWQTALSFQREGKLAVIPILVGSNHVIEGSKVYRRFEGFGIAHKLPEVKISPSPDNATVKETVLSLFKLQGIFLNPTDLADKLTLLQTRFSSEVWPTYRAQWEIQTDLGPEPQFTCVQCLQPYSDSENGDGVCRFHTADGPLQKFSKTYDCCQLKDPAMGCVRNKHNNKHHNKFEYGAFWNWRAMLTNDTRMSRSMAKVSAADHSANFAKDSAQATVGATLWGAQADSNALYVSASIRGGKHWFQIFSKQEVDAADARLPVFNLRGVRGEWVTGTWVTENGENDVAVGIKLECGTRTSVAPSCVTVLFEWPEIDDKNGPVASSIVFAKYDAFGEKPLPKSLAASPNPYNFPTNPMVAGDLIQDIVPRKRDTELPAWSAPESPLRMKVKEASARHDSYRKKDILSSTVSIFNTAKDPVSIVEARIYARLRGTQDPTSALKVPETGQGDENGDDLVLTLDWKKIETTYFSIGNKEGLPLTVPASGSASLDVYAHLKTARYHNKDTPSPDQKNYSWIAYRAGCPIVLDVEFEDVNGHIFGGMIEYCVPDLQLKTVDPESVFSLRLDDAGTANRAFTQISTRKEESYENAYLDPVVVRDHTPIFKFSTDHTREFGIPSFRYFVLEAEKVRSKSDASHNLGILDITSHVVSTELPYKEFSDYLTFRWYFHALIDFSRRCVVGIRIKGETIGMSTVGYYPVPEYGDATTAERVDGVLDGFGEADSTVSAWKLEEQRMGGLESAKPAMVQPKAPVSVRVVFAPPKTAESATTTSTIDVIALADALRPVIHQEVGAVLPIIVRHVDEAVRVAVKSAMEDVMGRVKELEKEREEMRSAVPRGAPGEQWTVAKSPNRAGAGAGGFFGWFNSSKK
ncbi:hypothetical protein HDU98_000921 [Podochytrium sp. JEL0797]|nr:hypothetical protein HDU98_000921 [Podochytrium sp. JEL0797]